MCSLAQSLRDLCVELSAPVEIGESMTAYEDLRAHLAQFQSLPFLFVGSGMSRRYLRTDTWNALLERMAQHTDRPFGFYRTKANDIPTRIASEIAAVFHPIWWQSADFTESRVRYGDDLTSSDSPLKVEVANYFSEALEHIEVSNIYTEEVEMFRKITVDGIITTNYDCLLEHLFPSFTSFIGQHELLFSNPTGIGEIYKIHGSCERPDSLVITQRDYEAFDI